MPAINLGRALIVVCFVGSALILQSTLLSRLGLPGATPDIVLVVVLALAMSSGPIVGTFIGFGAGVLVDLAPPAGGSVGQTAALYALAAFIASHVQIPAGKPDITTVGTVSGLASGVVLVQAILGTLLGTLAVTWSAVPMLVITQFLYCSVLAFLIVVPIGRLYRSAGDEGRYA